MSEAVAPTDPPGRASTILGWVPWAVMAAVVLGVTASCLWVGVAFYRLGSDSVVAIEPGEATDHLAWVLTDLGVDGPTPKLGPEHDRIKATLRGQIRAVKGSRTYGGMQGDGEDVYWAELSSELAAKVREVVSKSTRYKPYAYAPPGGSSVDWWPKEWPKGTKCYRDEGNYYLVIPDEGNQLWYMYWRL